MLRYLIDLKREKVCQTAASPPPLSFRNEFSAFGRQGETLAVYVVAAAKLLTSGASTVRV